MNDFQQEIAVYRNMQNSNVGMPFLQIPVNSQNFGLNICFDRVTT